MAFFNQHSWLFLLVGLVGVAGAGLWRWRRVNAWWRLGLFAWVVFGMLALALLTRYPAGYTPASLAQLESALEDDRPAFIMLYSQYCMGCILALPQVREIAPQIAERGAHVFLVDVRTPEGHLLAERLPFEFTPTYYWLGAGGELVWSRSSLPSLADL